MIFASPQQLIDAVATLCPDIAQRVASHSESFSEERLWWELSVCVLSSQVSFQVAIAAADAISESALLHDKDVPLIGLADKLENVLSHVVRVRGKHKTYRFPNARAKQLAETRRVVIAATDGSLGDLLARFADAHSAREWLVEHACGLGPKQASMFLRNVGVSYDLAILDRHVLNYMAEIGIAKNTRGVISMLNRYLVFEAALSDHAKTLGHSVGILDWAIWIVMRQARKPNLEFIFE
ncbi:hypothetical protein [Herbaspirillum sp. VT-16-41]|uniref:8-oxoguanine DNA glycosylase n=1 Tax=Herbaspirillum sp. VT-16-41 TaxID=1953765 RepID=UPI000980E08D|nr:hypothetical protein [Herbaspirillum sp. VT-16-41]ONN64993.1 hypothetical protein BTM36_19435 [Herbaspirillum sp. VT-16-41]